MRTVMGRDYGLANAVEERIVKANFLRQYALIIQCAHLENLMQLFEEPQQWKLPEIGLDFVFGNVPRIFAPPA